ncbi:uncharacterized protein LOC126575567 [Anopheles aquasalis]|uniref:uncharacterized protein LOC126575567 n=1 Tax=Anopheles aquasalis TaxID=42839 RepID=UPI00215B3FDD|nr:uncharacterized protein LOC126575567 [Anopheles aquasalis]
MTSSSYNKEQLAAKLYSSIKPFVFYSQLLCSVPYPVATLQSSCHLSFVYRSNFKQARCLLTAALMICIIICNLKGVIEMVSLSIPFFTTTLYINEMVLCAVASLLTVARSYKKDVAYNRFLQRLLTIACSLHDGEWERILPYLRRRLQCVCALLAVLIATGLTCVFYHFGGIYTTFLTLIGFVIPNVLVALSLLQYAYGVLLIYKLQQRFNCRLAIRELAPESELLHWIEQCESYYLQLAACIEHITQSFGLLIVTNTFAAINVISVLLLEIYQYLQTNDSKPIFIVNNLVWIGMQCVLLVLPLYPNHLLKGEQTRLGTLLFEVFPQGYEAHGEHRITRYGMLTLIRKEVYVKACGILTLDLSSLVSIFAALLSFMIIMIQFDQTNLNKDSGAVTAFDSLYSSNS